MFSSLSLRTKNLLLAVAMVFAFAFLGWGVLDVLKSTLIEERKKAIAENTQIAFDVIKAAYQKELSGEMTREEAQQAAIDMLRPMRFGESGYFFIQNSNVGQEGVAVMIPSKPSLEGTSLMGSKDPNGVLIAVELIKAAKNGGSGYIEYQWNKVGADLPVDKIAYVKGFQPWGWVIGTGVYLDDMNQVASYVVTKYAPQMMGSALMLVGVFVVVNLMVSGLIARVGGIKEHLGRMSEGDFSSHVELDSKDEFGEISASLVEVQVQMNSVLGSLKQSADRVGLGSKEIAVGNEDLAKRNEEQAQMVAGALGSVGNITVVTQSINDDVSSANAQAMTSRDIIRDGEQVVDQAVKAMSQITSSSARMSDIVSVIDDLAFQTNLLALNAAVEAARAGDQGRGFAVVASEVRNLAQKSATSAGEIRTLISQSVENVDAGSELVKRSGGILKEILERAESITHALTNVASKSEGNASEIEVVNANMGQLDGIVQQNAALVEQVATSSAQLSDSASDLLGIVGQFALKDERKVY